MALCFGAPPICLADTRAEAQKWVDKGLEIGDNSEAEAQCYRRAIEIDPFYAAAHFNLAYVYQANGEFEESIKEYEECIKHDPERKDAYLNIGMVKRHQGLTYDPEGAYKVYNRYCEITGEKEVEYLDIKDGLEQEISALKQVELKPFYSSEEIEQRLTCGFKRGASPYNGPRLPVMIEFDYNSARIKPETEEQLREMARALESEKLRSTSVIIEGHTDSRGPSEYNMNLSKKRAEAVKEFLVDKMRVPAEQLTVQWYGEDRPIFPNDTSENRQRNRRCEFVNKDKWEAIVDDVKTSTTRSSSPFDSLFR